MSVVELWEQTRRALVLELAALPSEGDVMEWQRRLAEAIIDAEQPPAEADKAEAKRHRHLLRVIGDGLVHELLDEHTIRALSRHPGRPASLSGQGTDFDFVLDQASQLQSRGVMPIVADLTTLIGVGDIIGRTKGDGVMIVECKNRAIPERIPTTGRLARQRERGEQVESYLTTSTINEGDSMRQAINMSLPSPDWNFVSELLEHCERSSTGYAASSLGSNDMLVAATSKATSEQVAKFMLDRINVPNPALVFYSDLIDRASYRLMAPSSYPVSGEQRWRLLEGKIRLVRIIDMYALSAEFDLDGASIALIPERVAGRFNIRIDVNGEEYVNFTHQIAEFCAWMPVPLTAMRETLSDHARGLVSGQISSSDTATGLELAPGDNVRYATLYRSN